MDGNKKNKKIDYGLRKLYLGIPLVFFIIYTGGYYADKGLKEFSQSRFMIEKRTKYEDIETFANSISDRSRMKWINEGIVEVDSDLDSIVDGYIIHIPARPGGIMYVPTK
jgi:hypothetical protein